MKEDQVLKQRRIQAQWTLALLFVLFLGPLILAYFLYHHATPLFTEHTVNHGLLLQPPVNFVDLEVKQLSQPPADYAGKWWVVFVTPTPCNTTCQDALYKIRQVRTALGKDQSRVQRLALIFETTDKKHLQQLALLLNGQYQGTYLGMIQRTKFNTVLKSRLEDKVDTDNGSFYIVDPHGNLILAYPVSVSPRNLYNDLTRLLKVSNIG